MPDRDLNTIKTFEYIKVLNMLVIEKVLNMCEYALEQDLNMP